MMTTGTTYRGGQLSPAGGSRFCLRLLVAAALVALCGLGWAQAAHASSEGPRWNIETRGNSNAAPGSDFRYMVSVLNVGDESMSTETTRLRVSLPPGMTVRDPAEVTGELLNLHWFNVWTETLSECTRPDGAPLTGGESELVCEASEPLVPARKNIHIIGYGYSLNIAVDVSPFIAAGEAVAHFEVTGGGAGSFSTVDPTLISPTEPPFGFDAFDGSLTSADGQPIQQAGGHPDAISTRIEFNTRTDPRALNGEAYPVAGPKDILVDLPPGLVGNPTGIAECTLAQLVNGVEFDVKPLCPSASQVGSVEVRAVFSGAATGAKFGNGREPVFKMVAPRGVAARFGFNVNGVPITVDAKLRKIDGVYRLSVGSEGIPEGLAPGGFAIEFWGSPADPVHDLDRQCPGQRPALDQGGSVAGEGPAGAPACPEAYTRPPITPFLRTPTNCEPSEAGLPAVARMDSWRNPGAFVQTSAPLDHFGPGAPHLPDEWGAPVQLSGCDSVPFTPSITVEPTSHEADTPTGLSVELRIPQDSWNDPGSISQSDLRDAVVTLPAGMSINPSSADGLGACTSAQIDLDSEAAPSCPDSSKIGTLLIETPLLDHPIPGVVYLAAQGDNPFNSVLALYFVAEDPQSGVLLKLAGKVEGDNHGTLTTTFIDQPQFPFSLLQVKLKSGPRAPLVNPVQCGTYTATSTLTGWSGAVAQPQSSFQVNSGPNGGDCAATKFKPSFSAGVTNQTAGSSSPFLLHITRGDGQPQITGLSVDLPKGLAGHLADLQRCPEANAGTGDCPPGSKIGVVQVGAGAGPDTLFVPQGSAYLAGPYKGAPLSLVTSVPAIAGPFNLGDVVVRSQLRINPESAQITVISDEIPQAVMGVAVHIRDLYVAINRDRFISTPTSCEPTSTGALLSSTSGETASLGSRFQMLECNALRFRPRLSIRLKGGTKRATNPGLTAVMRPKVGNANISRVQVALPHSEFLDQSHIKTICTRVQFAEGDGNGSACPKGSVYGKVRATSPLLGYPLTGNVYLRSSSHTLPDMVLALRGPAYEPIAIDAVGRIDSHKGGIRTTFEGLPDAPLTKVVLSLPAGKKSLIENSTDICRHRQKAEVKMDAQSGRISDFKAPLKVTCPRHKGAKKHHGH